MWGSGQGLVLNPCSHVSSCAALNKCFHPCENHFPICKMGIIFPFQNECFVKYQEQSGTCTYLLAFTIKSND